MTYEIWIDDVVVARTATVREARSVLLDMLDNGDIDHETYAEVYNAETLECVGSGEIQDIR